MPPYWTLHGRVYPKGRTLNMHASQLAQAMREGTWDKSAQRPAVAPNSTTESEALARIDAAREEEIARNEDTYESRERRARRYWGNHGRARS